MMTPEERYYHDPMFHRLVDMMHNEIINARYTPSELREAAMLAAIHYESQKGKKPTGTGTTGSKQSKSSWRSERGA